MWKFSASMRTHCQNSTYPRSGLLSLIESSYKQLGSINFNDANLLGQHQPQWMANTVTNKCFSWDLSGVSSLFSANLVRFSQGFESGQPQQSWLLNLKFGKQHALNIHGMKTFDLNVQLMFLLHLFQCMRYWTNPKHWVGIIRCAGVKTGAKRTYLGGIWGKISDRRGQKSW